MSFEMVVVIGGVIAFGVFVYYVINRVHRSKGTLDKAYYEKRWREIQELTRTEAGWTGAIVEADKLLDDALKKSGYSGKTMGERMVSASRAFSDTDKVWAAHKLRNKLVHEASFKLNKKVMVSAISGFRAGLKDLGAL